VWTAREEQKAGRSVRCEVHDARWPPRLKLTQAHPARPRARAWAGASCAGAPDAAPAARRTRAIGGMSAMPEVASIVLGFLPLNHLMGRTGILQCMGAGGYTTFVRA